MNTEILYRPAARWPIIAALVAALTIESAAVGLANLRRLDAIPTVTGILSPQPIEAEFIPVPPDPLPPESAPPPQQPPPPDTPLDFTMVEPVLPPKPPRKTPPTNAPHVAHLASAPATLASSHARLTNAPPPAYPYEARRARATGSGVFLLRFNAQGEVTEVVVSRSTGNAVLDQISLGTFRRWRCEAGAYQAVYVPVTFTLAGAHL